MDELTCPVAGEGTAPAYAHEGDAGADLHAACDDVIPPRSRKLVATGVRIALPENHVGLIWPRSGLAVKQGIDTGAGVIDSGYRGEVKILLFNHTDEPYTVSKGDRIAQLLIQKVERVRFIPVDELPGAGRGEGGFGSTGQ